MRRTILVLSLALATMTMLAGDAFAQRRGGGGRGRGGFESGRFFGRPYGYGYGYGFGDGGWGYYSDPGYIVDSPSNYYADPVVQVPSTDMRRSFYAGPEAANQARVTVLLPAGDAQVWFNGVATTQQGMQRVFSSPPLEQGYTYTYTVKARWMENGRMIDRERQVNVQNGQAVVVDFRNNTGERIATPKQSPNPNPNP